MSFFSGLHLDFYQPPVLQDGGVVPILLLGPMAVARLAQVHTRCGEVDVREEFVVLVRSAGADLVGAVQYERGV